MTMWQCVLIAKPWQVEGVGGLVITWSVQSGHTISRTTIHKQYIDEGIWGMRMRITNYTNTQRLGHILLIQRAHLMSYRRSTATHKYTHTIIYQNIYTFNILYFYTNMFTYLSSNLNWHGRTCINTQISDPFVYGGHLIKCKYNHCQSGHTITPYQWSAAYTRGKTENNTR